MRVRFLRNAGNRDRGTIADLDPDTADWLTARGYTQHIDPGADRPPTKPPRRRSRTATEGVGDDPPTPESDTGPV